MGRHAGHFAIRAWMANNPSGDLETTARRMSADAARHPSLALRTAQSESRSQRSLSNDECSGVRLRRSA